LQGKPQYATTLFSKTLDTLQAHLHPEQSSMAHTWHQQIQITQQRSSLQRLQPFENDTQKFGIHHHHSRAMETVLEGNKHRDVIIRIGATLWALHSGEQVGYYLPLPCSTSDSDTGSRGAAGKVVARTVGDAVEDPWSNPGDEAVKNLGYRGQFQRNE
jgi:hypothetical protein